MTVMVEFCEIGVPLPDAQVAYGRYWAAPNARGAVLYHHGIQSHCGWYEGSAAALANAGFCVLQVDRRGCGRNEAGRGDAESSEQLIADAHAARDELHRRSGFDRHHVVGISWGGKLAVAAHVDDAAGVRSLSLVTPGLFPLVGVSKGTMAKIGFAMLYEPDHLFAIPLDDPDMFTAVAAWQAFIATDRRTLRKCTARFYLASRRMDRTVAKMSSATPVPLHLFLAGEERIVDNDKTVGFVESLGWESLQITRFAQARHSLEFEADPEPYYRKLVSFIERLG